MRLLAYLRKTFLENLREWKILIMSLVFAPVFVFIMYAYFGASNPSYSLLVLNEDKPAALSGGQNLRAGEDLVAEWGKLKYPDGKPVFKIRAVGSTEEGTRLIKNRDADMMVAVPKDLSQSIEDFRRERRESPAPIRNIGDLSSPRFMVAASFADFVTYTTIASVAGVKLPEAVVFEGIGSARSPTEFDLYVPALLALAVMMILFTAAASIIKEVDKGTIVRLTLSKLTTFEFLSAVSLNQLLIGMGALGLAYLSAISVGFRSGGSAVLFLVTGSLSILSVVAISLVVAGFIRTIYELLTVGVFPFFILMFFSEMFPLPRIPVFRLTGHIFYANDILPTTLTVKAFNKILNFGAGGKDLVFELGGMLVLTVFYFSIGLWLFKKRHLRTK